MGLLVKGQHCAWCLGTVFNLKTPLGLEGGGCCWQCNRKCTGSGVKEGGGCLGEVRSGGDVWRCGEEEKEMGVGEVIREFLMKELTN